MATEPLLRAPYEKLSLATGPWFHTLLQLGRARSGGDAESGIDATSSSSQSTTPEVGGQRGVLGPGTNEGPWPGTINVANLSTRSLPSCREAGSVA
jgi:hypothetical protein